METQFSATSAADNRKVNMDFDSGMRSAKYILGISAVLDSAPLIILENTCWQGLLESCTIVDYGCNTQSSKIFVWKGDITRFGGNPEYY